ncbi:hypothetical protein E5672_18085 [Alteromonas portus]|uniref:Uncharacterized protein n=1 Tax=Alteromonas portus TaxID=2565549 RepID=A0A4U0Z937_9ALTE|nr:hypothetical protein [Alteromonas portus]TKB01137.1 hypothetical protein E5672_18085 [Alteromonas portus]
MDASMVEGRVNRYGLEWHCFAQIRLPSSSALRALLLSLGINGGLLLALAFTTANKPAGQQPLPPLLLKAVLLQPPTIPQKTETKPKLVHETHADVEGGVVLKEAKKKETPSIASRPENESEGAQAPLEKEVSAQPLLRAKDVRLRIQDATKNYINRLNAQRLQNIANQLSSNKTHSNVKKSQKLSNSFNTENEDFLESIEIIVDCSTLKGKFFSALSKNKGIAIEDRDFPSSPNTPTVQGTVKCRDNSRFNDYINRRVNKE